MKNYPFYKNESAYKEKLIIRIKRMKKKKKTGQYSKNKKIIFLT